MAGWYRKNLPVGHARNRRDDAHTFYGLQREEAEPKSLQAQGGNGMADSNTLLTSAHVAMTLLDGATETKAGTALPGRP